VNAKGIFSFLLALLLIALGACSPASSTVPTPDPSPDVQQQAQVDVPLTVEPSAAVLIPSASPSPDVPLQADAVSAHPQISFGPDVLVFNICDLIPVEELSFVHAPLPDPMYGSFYLDNEMNMMCVYYGKWGKIRFYIDNNWRNFYSIEPRFREDGGEYRKAPYDYHQFTISDNVVHTIGNQNTFEGFLIRSDFWMQISIEAESYHYDFEREAIWMERIAGLLPPEGQRIAPQYPSDFLLPCELLPEETIELIFSKQPARELKWAWFQGCVFYDPDIYEVLALNPTDFEDAYIPQDYIIHDDDEYEAVIERIVLDIFVFSLDDYSENDFFSDQIESCSTNIQSHSPKGMIHVFGDCKEGIEPVDFIGYLIRNDAIIIVKASGDDYFGDPDRELAMMNAIAERLPPDKPLLNRIDACELITIEEVSRFSATPCEYLARSYDPPVCQCDNDFMRFDLWITPTNYPQKSQDIREGMIDRRAKRVRHPEAEIYILKSVFDTDMASYNRFEGVFIVDQYIVEIEAYGDEYQVDFKREAEWMQTIADRIANYLKGQ
jgi:hypothetical protein